ncbi:MAG: hypothetical protein Q8J71_07925 [Brevundimonas sp.]|nr:hypothetical protein [Brevundimonas sp.]
MRLSAMILALALLAGAAAADIHPRHHAAARAAAANVVVMSIDRLEDHGLTGMGDCTLTGRVLSVERGPLLSPGQSLTVTVPCHVTGANLPASPVQWQAVERLRLARQGRVWLNAEGGQIARRYFEILPWRFRAAEVQGRGQAGDGAALNRAG